ncbi:MAG TPA: glycosyltransferase [Anaerohalosphaeraceae bacterium]|nr:glycosyltransferase [Anaerohalosphaeraceae bacterium]
MLNDSKRIFLIADFKNDSPKSIRLERRRWVKGLIRLGHDVQPFSFWDIAEQKRKWLLPMKHRWEKAKAFEIMLEQIRCYYPDILILCVLKYFNTEMIREIRKAAPRAFLVGRDVDSYPRNYVPRWFEILKMLDLAIVTNAGVWMQKFKDQGVSRCAFLPCPCDPDIQRPYPNVEEKWKSDIIFTGPEGHKRFSAEADKERQLLLERLRNRQGVRLYGCFGFPTLDGIEVFQAISAAKIALSINVVNDVPLYHSDRLVNCLACGTFTLAKRVPDSDLLFQDGKHLRYFDTAEEFFELAEWYLAHEEERERIARAGMEHAHREFNCTKMARHLMDLIRTGDYNAPWKVIL